MSTRAHRPGPEMTGVWRTRLLPTKARTLRGYDEVSSNQVICLLSVESSVRARDCANLRRQKIEHQTENSQLVLFLVDSTGLSLIGAFCLSSDDLNCALNPFRLGRIALHLAHPTCLLVVREPVAIRRSSGVREPVFRARLHCVG